MQSLEQLREKITAIDQQLIPLFKERFRLASEVARFKQAHHLPILQPERERAILSQLAQEVSDPDLLPIFQDLWHAVFEASRHWQEKQ